MSEAKMKTPISQEKMAGLTKEVTAAQDACYELESVASGLTDQMQQLLDRYDWPKRAKDEAEIVLNCIADLEHTADEANRESERALGTLMDLNERYLPKVYDVLDTYSENELLEALVRKQSAREAEEKKKK